MPVFLCTSSHQHWCEPTVSLALKRIASLVFTRRTTTPHQHQYQQQQLPRPNFRGNCAANFNWRAAECWIERPGAPCPDKNLSTFGARYGRDEGGGEKIKASVAFMCHGWKDTQVPGTKAWPGAIIPDCDHLRPPSKSQITGIQRSCESYIDLGA